MRSLTNFAVISLLIFSTEAKAQTLDEFVASEKSASFGECVLLPKPDLKGQKIKVVIPQRFEPQHQEISQPIFLVGTDSSNNVIDKLEIKFAHNYSPKEIISVTCQGSHLTISAAGKVNPRIFIYAWNGKSLTRVSKGLAR